MTHQERIEALQEFGYNERESAFLVLAALHSGYFVRRQYNQFVNCGHGTTAIQLVQRTSANRHSRMAVFPRNTGVYHLCSRPFYQALGDPNNRNRRRRSLPAIKVKLMALDFVLAHPDLDYLATEREKVEHFSDYRSISLEQLYQERRFQDLTKASLIQLKRARPAAVRRFGDPISFRTLEKRRRLGGSRRG
jgi:hypothetical protein